MTMHPADHPRTQTEWEAAAKDLLDEGQAFLAYDLAREGLAEYPESLPLKQTLAQALRRTGALAEARAILEPLCPPVAPDPARLLALYGELRGLLGAAPARPAPDMLEVLTELVAEYARAGELLPQGPAADEETLGLLARVYKDLWQQSDREDDARRSRDTYLRGFHLSGGIYTGINAATMSWLLGEQDFARAIARRVLARCDASGVADGDDAYWRLATRGEAHLLLGDAAAAVDAYREAAALAGRRYAYIVSSLQQIKLLAGHGYPIPEPLWEILKPPSVVVFSGHMLDLPGRPVPRFPADREEAVRRAIDTHLAELDARIGYSSAACGGDLLFVEAMLARDGEVNLVLPFDRDDFIATSVAHGGPEWIKRFERALASAHTVKYVTEERYLGDNLLFSFANQVFMGYANLRARTLETEPALLAVWDGLPPGGPGGTGEVVAHWPDKARVRIIPVSGGAPGAADAPAPAPGTPAARRVIKTMLFADVMGYSKLQEQYVPFFMHEFLAHVREELARLPHQPGFVNTWGDAFFVVMDEAAPLVEYALALLEVVTETDWAARGLPGEMNLRVGLHAGPVYECVDPFTGDPNFYGSHVNRAARIEPVTAPGHIYASEQFVGLLTGEMDAAGVAPYACDYVGTLALAKKFGVLPMYHVRRQ